MVLNLDNILQQTNNSARDNTITMPSVNTITMLSTSTFRFKVTPTEMELNAISEAKTQPINRQDLESNYIEVLK